MFTDCQLVVDIDPITEPVNCFIRDSCTAISCCAEVGFLQQSFEIYMTLDPCTDTIQVGIEKLNFNVSLSAITMGKGDNSETWQLQLEFCLQIQISY